MVRRSTATTDPRTPATILNVVPLALVEAVAAAVFLAELTTEAVGDTIAEFEGSALTTSCVMFELGKRNK